MIAAGLIACSDSVPSSPHAASNAADAMAQDTSDQVYDIRDVDTGAKLNQTLAELQGLIKYPEEAKKQGVGGLVTVEYVVDENANVTNARVVSSDHPLLNEAALEAVKKLPFVKPALLDGEPVKVRTLFPISFHLGMDPNIGNIPPPRPEKEE